MNSRERLQVTGVAVLTLLGGISIGVTGAEANRDKGPHERPWVLEGTIRQDQLGETLARVEARCGMKALPAEVALEPHGNRFNAYGRCTTTFRAGP